MLLRERMWKLFCHHFEWCQLDWFDQRKYVIYQTATVRGRPRGICQRTNHPVPSRCSPCGESHEYLMRQARTHSLHHTFSLIHVINQSSNWELYVRWLSVSVCQIHDYYLLNSVLLFVIPLVLAPERCLLHIHVDVSMVQLVTLDLLLWISVIKFIHIIFEYIKYKLGLLMR